jgi:DNA-binding transcriptional ArsR family regulator
MLESGSDVFRAVADPTRRAMLELLADSDLSAGDLGRPFRISQPAVSQHLRVLRDAGLIRGRRDGRQRVYSLDRKPLERIRRWAARQIGDPFGHVWNVRHGGRGFGGPQGTPTK